MPTFYHSGGGVRQGFAAPTFPVRAPEGAAPTSAIGWSNSRASLRKGRTDAEDLLRQLAPQVLGALVRRYGHFDTAEDAVQEPLLAAATQWPAEGLPGSPRGWLIMVASRRLTDLLRSEQSRRAREEAAARRIPPGEWLAPGADAAAA
jgi:DNA-directed RNA polymerase specialized sigma24 family protein